MPGPHFCSLSAPGWAVQGPQLVSRGLAKPNTQPAPRRRSRPASPAQVLWTRPQLCGAHPPLAPPPLPPPPVEALPPLTFATRPPGELWAGSPRQLPPPLAGMSSFGFGNFQSSQECLLKCSRPREQREQNGALRPACARRKQSAITQTGWLHQA